nr:reverse transcriptase domain-containing protein [Tanacetum cinerariifolium]
MADRTMEELLQAPTEGICAAMGTYNQVSPPNRASNQMAPPSFASVQNIQNSNTIANAKGGMKVVTTHSGLAYEGPSIPTLLPRSFAEALVLMLKFAFTIKSLLTNKDKLFELAKVSLNENCLAMLLKKLPEKLGDPGKFLIPYVLDFKYNSKSDNPTLVSNPLLSKETKSEFCKEPIVKSSSPILTLFGESDFLLEEIEDFLKDESIPTGIEDSYYDSEGDILYLEKLLNDDLS